MDMDLTSIGLSANSEVAQGEAPPRCCGRSTPDKVRRGIAARAEDQSRPSGSDLEGMGYFARAYFARDGVDHEALGARVRRDLARSESARSRPDDDARGAAPVA